MTEGNGRSPWFYVGCGCLFLVAVGIAGSIALAFWARTLKTDMASADRRTEKAQEVLGVAELPEGYHVAMAMGIPFVLDTVILTDGEQPPDGEVDPQFHGEHGFLYTNTFKIGDDDELRDFFEGRTKDTDALEQAGINLRLDERVAQGELDIVGGKALWVTHRGELGGLQDSRDGLNTVVMFQCERGRGRRTGIWWGPDPQPDASEAEIDLQGSVGDLAMVAQFVSPFRLCDRR